MTRTTKFLNALCAKLRELDDPDPKVITHESYSWGMKNQKAGKIPKVTFRPYGKSTKIKADIMRSAGLHDPARQKEIAKLRQEIGITKARHKEDRILASLFESYWNRYWQQKIKAIEALEEVQHSFLIPGQADQTIAEPIRLIMEQLNPALKLKKSEKAKSKPEKPYIEELAELK